MLAGRINKLVARIKENIGFLLSITFGIFLFILFFQPFSIDGFNFNNRLLFVAGFVAIIFLFMVLVRTTFRTLIHDKFSENENTLVFSYACGFLILAFSTVALAFYLRYVGLIELSFYIVFKLVLICLVPPVILNVFDQFQKLKYQNELLLGEKENIMKEIERYEDDYLNQTIEFISEYSADQLNLSIADVILLRSADNYVEIIYREGQGIKRKLIRSTLKNIQQQLKPFSNFIRCHRTSIVNTFHVEKLTKKYNTHLLQIRDFDEPVPVSRQYLLKIKELF